MFDIFNLAWLLIFAVAQVALWRHVGRHPQQRREYWRVAVLVACLVVIMFPIVSRSDDMAWAQQLMSNPDMIGVTQTTRVFSRYDLMLDVDRNASTIMDMLRDLCSRTQRRLCFDVDSTAASQTAHRSDRLRAPPIQG